MIPHGACGQFLNNCLSMSEKIMPVSGDDFIDEILYNGMNQDKKFEYMLSAFPDRSEQSQWHGKFYHSSRWYSPCHWARKSMDLDDTTNGYFMFGLDPSYARSYMENYWRDHAVKVSQADYGIILPSHEIRDKLGWKSIFPNAKVYSVTNYEQISYLMTANKKGNDSPKIILEYYKQNPHVYEPDGYVFDLMALLKYEESYHTQMQRCFEYMELTDFIYCWPTLKEYRLRYLHANMQWSDQIRNALI